MNYQIFKALIDQLPNTPYTPEQVKVDDLFPEILTPWSTLEQELVRFLINKNAFSYDDLSISKNNRENYPSASAYYCLRDLVRTKRFLQAVDLAVSKLVSQKETIRVLDAGCGPFAILGLLAALASENAEVDCLEINLSSVEQARKTIKAFGLENRVRIYQEDACKYQPENTYDLIISETMMSGFITEPIIEIMANLVNYLNPGGILLPTAASYKTAYVEEGAVTNLRYCYGEKKHNYRVINFTDWQEQFSWQAGDPLKEILLDIEIPKSNVSLQPFVATDLHLIDQLYLKDYDSQLSRPMPVFTEILNPESCSSDDVKFVDGKHYTQLIIPPYVNNQQLKIAYPVGVRGPAPIAYLYD